MSAVRIRVLLVEDNTDDAELILRELKRGSLDPVWERVDTEADYLARLDPSFDVILADYSMPRFSGARALELLKERGLDVPFIVVSGSIGEEIAVRVLKSGAADYLLKDRLGRLAQAVQRAIEERRVQAERRRLEDQTRQSQKMEAIGQLAGGIAHDFNNLLTAVLVNCSLLAESLPADAPQLEEVAEIRRAAERATALTRQLLAFSRRQVLSPQVVDLRQSVTALEPMLSRLIDANIEIVVRVGDDAATVRADPGQMEQVILNLAINARDAMPNGGTLTLDVSSITLDATHRRRRDDIPQGTYVRLAVTDTGTGMDAATIARIFEPFFTTKPQGRGTGLGLSTVYGIVTQSGGRINVDSTPGRGTTFTVMLPRVDDEMPAAVFDEATQAAATGTERVLVVEDEDSIGALVQRILTRLGYQVSLVTTPEHALELFEANRDLPFDLLLTDCALPGLTGQALAERAAVLSPATRVLYMTGYTDVALPPSLDRAAVLLQKPFTPDALAAKVRDILDA